MIEYGLAVAAPGKFMMIAQPNHDGSFSCTLFMPFSREHSPTGAFDMLKTEDDVLAFFT